MKYLIVMRTINRDYSINDYTDNFIHTTINSLIKSDLFKSKCDFEFHLFDGGVPLNDKLLPISIEKPSIEYLNKYKYLKNTFIHCADKYLTKNENWLRMISETKYIVYDYLIMLEDDLVFCNKWIESINLFCNKYENLLNNHPFISFYASYKEIEKEYKKGKEYWDQYTAEQFYGTQCILFKKKKALECFDYISNGIENINDIVFKKPRNTELLKIRCIDLWIQEWLMNKYPDSNVVASCPSFVQHIGEKTASHLNLHQSFKFDDDSNFYKKNSVFYNKSYQNNQRNKPYIYGKEIIPYLKTFINIKSIVDVGCGGCGFLKAAQENGIEDILGIDGPYINNNSLLIPKENFVAWNLEDEFIYNKKFTLVVSLEVAEHIDEKYATTFIKTLTGLGNIVLFSAAQTNQGGINHVNCQSLEYWEKRFNKFGFIKHSDDVKNFINDKEHVNQWYRKNSVLYIKKPY